MKRPARLFSAQAFRFTVSDLCKIRGLPEWDAITVPGMANDPATQVGGRQPF
jgi:hypothetical protein